MQLGYSQNQNPTLLGFSTTWSRTLAGSFWSMAGTWSCPITLRLAPASSMAIPWLCMASRWFWLTKPPALFVSPGCIFLATRRRNHHFWFWVGFRTIVYADMGNPLYPWLPRLYTWLPCLLPQRISCLQHVGCEPQAFGGIRWPNMFHNRCAPSHSTLRRPLGWSPIRHWMLRKARIGQRWQSHGHLSSVGILRANDPRAPQSLQCVFAMRAEPTTHPF